jgi:hypothetical protein
LACRREIGACRAKSLIFACGKMQKLYMRRLDEYGTSIGPGKTGH